MKSRQILALAVAILVMSSLGVSAYLYQKTAPAMTDAANAFLETLPEDQKKMAVMEYDTSERVAWHFIPKPFKGDKARKGLTLKSMSEKSRTAAQDLLKTGLSESGYDKALQVMMLETIVGKLEGPRPDVPWTRDAEMYYFSVFGTPGKGRWGWRCEGHHLSLNFVVENNQLLSATPSFWGANPGNVPSGEDKGLRVLAKREDLARELLKSCDEEQTTTVMQSDTAPADLRSAGDAQPPTTPAVGLAAEKMTKSQKKVLRLLLETYAQTMAPEVARTWLEGVKKAGPEQIHFAWWGSAEPGKGHYYRVQGPTFLVEFNNTQNNANHIHSIWRDLSGDFAIPLAKK